MILKRYVAMGCLTAHIIGCSVSGEDSSSSNRQPGATENVASTNLSTSYSRPYEKPAIKTQDLSAAYLAAAERFGDKLVLGEDQGNPLDKPKSEWEHRLAKCGDQDCREQVIGDQINRLQFALGKARSPVDGVPWPNGSFIIHDPEFEGNLSILPIIDDLILLRVDTSQRPDASWICTIIAVGRLSLGGTARMTSLGDDERTFELRQASTSQLILGPLARSRDEPDPCYPTGMLFGTYSIAPPATP